MKLVRASRTEQGTTRIEILVLLMTTVVLLMMGTWFLTSFNGRGVQSRRAACAANLKQIGLALTLWKNDHQGMVPWQVSTRDRGTREYADSAETFRHFLALSNQLDDPKAFVCSADKQRFPTGSGSRPTNNQHISYFVGLDPNRPDSIVSGDRNVLGGVATSAGAVFDPSNTPSWSRTMHVTVGNVLQNDGSVQAFTSTGLKALFEESFAGRGPGEIRLAIPRVAGEPLIP